MYDKRVKSAEVLDGLGLPARGRMGSRSTPAKARREAKGCRSTRNAMSASWRAGGFPLFSSECHPSRSGLVRRFMIGAEWPAIPACQEVLAPNGEGAEHGQLPVRHDLGEPRGEALGPHLLGHSRPA